jgi:uncharacterized protein (TIGR03437 family)
MTRLPVGRGLLALFLLAGSLSATPKLRLVSTTVGPVSIATGSNGSTRTVESYNAGDGTLVPQLTASATWMVPTVGATRSCTSRSGSCIPLNIALQTASLTKGIYTGTVTVSDSNAIDAPQTITVTVQMGGGVPETVTLYASPGTSAMKTFTTNSSLGSSISTTSGGSWLSMTLNGGGSYDFAIPYAITAKALSGMVEGAYQGVVTVSKSAVAAENRAVPVTFNVTSKPIAAVSPESLSFRLMVGAAKLTRYASLSNSGLGTLSVSGYALSPTDASKWLSVGIDSGSSLLSATVDPSSLAVGHYDSTIVLATNAANTFLYIPVAVDVIAVGAPVVAYQGLLSNATFTVGDPVAQGDIVALFGEHFTLGSATQPGALPLPVTLGGAKVYVNDTPAPIYFTSYNQINLQIPYETAAGEARVQVERDGVKGNTISVQVAARVPRLMTVSGQYAIAVNTDGTFAMPVTAGLASHPAKPGDALVFYGLGFGPAVPAVASGAGAPSQEPFARIVPTPSVYFGGGMFASGVEAVPFFVGLCPGFVGLTQMNVFVPQNVPTGSSIPVQVKGTNYTSNIVYIAVQ